MSYSENPYASPDVFAAQAAADARADFLTKTYLHLAGAIALGAWLLQPRQPEAPPRLPTHLTLTLPEGEMAVTGQAWLDREWSSQPLAETQRALRAVCARR